MLSKAVTKFPMINQNQDLLRRLEDSNQNLERLALKTRDMSDDLVSNLKNKNRDIKRQFFELAAVVQDGLVILNKDGIITDFSPPSVKIFGYSKEEALGKKIDLFLEKDLLETFNQLLKNITDPKISMKNGYAIRKDGNKINIEFTVSKLTLNDEPYDFIVFRDVTKQIQYQLEIETTNKVLIVVAECSKLWTVNDWRDSIDLGLEKLGLAIDACAVGVYEIKGEICKLQNIWKSEDNDLDLEEFKDVEKINTKSLNKKLFKKQIITLDIENQDDAKILKGTKHKSLLIVPIISNEKLWGYFTVHFTKERKEWFSQVIHSIGTLADILGSALERKGRKKEIHILQETLNNLSDSLLIANSEGDILFTNRAFCKEIGKDYKDIIGKNFWKGNKSLPEDFWTTLEQGETWQGPINLQSGRGNMTTDSVVVPVLNGNRQKPSYFIAIKTPFRRN